MILISTIKGMIILKSCTDLKKYTFRFLKATCAGHALEVVGGVVGKTLMYDYYQIQNI